jgi:chloramphenicol 3-O-phosphotransferase
MTTPGQLVILNGPPRSGKSSIAAAIQNSFEGVWMNLGVDGCRVATLLLNTHYSPAGDLPPHLTPPAAVG